MFNKLTAFTKKVADLADKPTLNATDLKAQFDAAPNEVRTYLNNLIDDLASIGIGGTWSAGKQVATTDQEVEISATLVNAWVNSYANQFARYYKDNFGMVHIYGRIKSGTMTDGTTVFTLPAGYRPKETIYVQGRGTNYQIATDGTVKIYACSANLDVGLDNIHFRAYN